MRPLIGITSYAQHASWGHWQAPAVLVPLAYVDSVTAAGGRPLVLPPLADGAEETLEALDGLVLSGGADVDPALYAAEAHPATSSQPLRDEAEVALLARALELRLPVLAICRGMQLLNVLRGGSLHQHVPELVGHDGHRLERGTFSPHRVVAAPDSRVAAAIGTRANVPSSHHQAPDVLGDGLVPVAWDDDGIVEALEDPTLPFAVGVLWHPEEETEKRLFASLVAAARAYREEAR